MGQGPVRRSWLCEVRLLGAGYAGRAARYFRDDDEDLLRIGQQIAGWSLSRADVLRKITKLKEKGAALVAKTENEFVEDAMKHSKLDRPLAQMIWDDVVVPFAKYGFCQSLPGSTN